MFEKLKDQVRGMQSVMKHMGGYIFQETSLPVTDRVINLILEKNLDRLSETVGAEFKRAEINSAPDGVNIGGTVIKSGVAADFFLKVIPLEPVWLENNHQVRFKVTERSLVIDKGDIRGLLASLWNGILSAVTGEDLLISTLRCLADENGVISFGLDGLDKRMDGAMRVLQLTRITPMEGRIVVAGRLSIKSAFAVETILSGGSPHENKMATSLE